MKIFISGVKSQNSEAIKKLKEIVSNDKKSMLYISLDESFNTLEKNEIFDFYGENIEIVSSAKSLENKKFSNYSLVYFGSSNANMILSMLKNSNRYEEFLIYLESSCLVWTESVSSTIFGKYIDFEKTIDTNINDFSGLNFINGFSVYAGNINTSREEYLKHFKCSKVIVVPEDVTLYMECGKYEVFGNKPFYIFESGNKIEFNSKKDKINLFENLKTPEELMGFMNENITYGWLDKKGLYHFNNLNCFREDYKTNTLYETLNYGVGTCIEQANVIKFFFDNQNIENKLFCHRTYENDEQLLNEVKMHCFVLYKSNNLWNHFEHSNSPKRGIYTYETVDDAILNITSGFSENDIRTVTEIENIRESINFLEFNQYVNSFEEYRKGGK